MANNQIGRCVITFTTKMMGTRVLGEITIQVNNFTWLNARDQVIKMLLANGVREIDILPCNRGWTQIDLVGGSSVTISPLVSFEKYAGCVASYMDKGTDIDLYPSEYCEVAGVPA